MQQKTTNFKHSTLQCPNCKTNKNTLEDTHHQEIFCNTCGTVIQDTKLVSITQIIAERNYKDKYIKDLWKKPRKKF